MLVSNHQGLCPYLDFLHRTTQIETETKLAFDAFVVLTVVAEYIPSFRLRFPYEPSVSGAHLNLEVLLELECFAYAEREAKSKHY